jgi:hypothetical protein
MAVSSVDAKRTPGAQLRSLIDKFDAKDQKLIRSVRSAVRKRLPSANELVYDYNTFFVISYSSTERPPDAIVATAARPDGVRLYLMQGPRLPDPQKLLMGSGKQTRFIRVEAARQLAHPDVEALIAAAIDLGRHLTRLDPESTWGKSWRYSSSRRPMPQRVPGRWHCRRFPSRHSRESPIDPTFGRTDALRVFAAQLVSR